MATLYLHIGTHKTGSTYLQNYLKENVDGLRRQGWSYPEFLGSPNHLSLPFIFEGRITPIYQVVGLGDEAALAAAKQQWVDGLTANVTPDSRWIITSEFFTRRFVRREQVDAVIEFLRQWFDEIIVVAYIRRQEYILPSIYSQDVKAGRQWDWSWEYCEERFPTIDYNAIYDLWNDAEGVNEVRMVPFLESSKRDNRKVLEQFTELTGVEFRADWVEPPKLKSNRSLSVEGIAFLWAINPHLPRIATSGRSNRPFRGRVMERIMDLTPGSTFNPADDLIERVHEHFRDSNQAFIEKLPQNPLWSDWLDQPTHDDKPQALIPTLSAERTADLMITLSQPSGPIAWGEEDKRPIPPVPFRELTKQKVAQRIHRLRRAGAK